ncbi:MAG: SDR family oxidoreductase [Azospirillaceae bacterium]
MTAKMAEETAGEMDARRVVVTGGTGSLGEALIRGFARRGARVGITARSPEKAERLTARLAAEGIRIDVAIADLAAPETAATAVTALADRLGGLDVLVNNAGHGVRRGLDEATPENWATSFAITVSAPYFAARAAAAAMTRGGVIVNIASEMAHLVSGASMVYATSKAALVHLNGCLADALATRGIRVLAVSPGPFESDLLLSNIDQSGVGRDSGLTQMAARVPLGRIATAEEIAETILFIASDRAAYMTGSVIRLDGGTTIPRRQEPRPAG